MNLADMLARNQRIMALCQPHATKAGMAKLQLDLVADPNITVEQATGKILELLGKDAEPLAGGGDLAHTLMGDDARDKWKAAATNMLLHSANPKKHKLTPEGREMQGTSLMRLGEESLANEGQTLRKIPGHKKARAMLTTSDLAHVVGEVLVTTLEDGYESVESNYELWSARRTVKTMDNEPTGMVWTDTQLEQVAEAGEYSLGGMTDSEETLRAAKFGKVAALSWEMIQGDKLNVVARFLRDQGVAAKELEIRLVYGELLAARKLQRDGRPIFDARHGNIATAGPITQAVYEAAFTTYKKARNPNKGTGFMRVAPKFWLVPPGDLPVATKVAAGQGIKYDATTGQVIQEANVYAGKITVLDDPHMDGDFMRRFKGDLVAPNDASFFMPDPDKFPTVVHAFLEGYETPQTADWFDESRDCRMYKIRHVFATGVENFYGAFKLPKR